MKILTTGGNGFLGKKCTKLFKYRLHDVISTDREGQIDLIGDLSDSNFVSILLNVDAVVHCAAVQYVTKYLPIFFRESYFQKNNVHATKNLCDRYHGTSMHFINIGTSMMYKQTGQYVYHTDDQKVGEGVYSPRLMRKFTWMIFCRIGNSYPLYHRW